MSRSFICALMFSVPASTRLEDPSKKGTKRTAKSAPINPCPSREGPYSFVALIIVTVVIQVDEGVYVFHSQPDGSLRPSIMLCIEALRCYFAERCTHFINIQSTICAMEWTVGWDLVP